MIQITQRDEKYGLVSWVNGNYQVAATIIVGLATSDDYYGCDRVDGSNNCVRCLPGFELAPLGRNIIRCFCKRSYYYDSAVTRNCLSCGSDFSKRKTV